MVGYIGSDTGLEPQSCNILDHKKTKETNKILRASMESKSVTIP